MTLTYNELRDIADNPAASKTIAPNTIVISSGINAVRVILHGNAIYDVLENGYHCGDSMRILPSAFTWFSNTTHSRIALVCEAYGFAVNRKARPEPHYIITKKNGYGRITIKHLIYEDSYPFPLAYNPESVSFNDEYRGYRISLDGDYTHYIARW